jgi:lysyl endopeptidase
MRFVRALLAAFFLLPVLALAGQYVPDRSDLDAVPVHELAAAAVQKGIETAQARKDLPLQFAVAVPLPLGLADGRWDETTDGLSRWRLQLRSPGALSLHVHFDRFRVPAGAELWLYDADGALVQGPLTQADENPDGRLATALVLGETAVLELRVPSAQRAAVDLVLGEVFHGFRDFRKDGPQAKAGACERDVVCPEGEAWSEQIRSVARLQNGQYLCSGQLVNNTRQDETPFLITANHCKVDAQTASNLVTYFNFQSTTCGGNDGRLDQFVSGAQFRSAHEGSDYTLVVLNTPPPGTFNAYYSGWNVTGDPVNSGSGIHHPQGDEKSISLFDTAARKADGVCSAQENGTCVMRIDAWEVGWSSGVTEKGSSGSGLWNQSRQLVGVLSGGSSACSGSTGNGQTDFYGRLDTAWNRGGLREQLDAAGTGATELQGKCAGGTPGCPGVPQAAVTAPEAKPGTTRFGGALCLLTAALLALGALRRRR